MNITTVNDNIKEIQEGNILCAKGYKTGGYHTGIRNNKKDLGIIVSDNLANAAAVYTKSITQAAPIKVTKDTMSQGAQIQAIIVNSGNANAATGEQGMLDAYEMRNATAKKLGIENTQVAVASTGVIGQLLNMDKIKAGIDQIEFLDSSECAADFEKAILTTDTFQKHCAFQAEINGVTVTVGGAAKGSGMIHPNMGTMLGFLTCDANVSSENLQLALSQCIDSTFNQITVDGDTSTNDMVILLANGQSNSDELAPGHEGWDTFVQLIALTCKDLAKKIARDGEGATKLIEVNVEGAQSISDARALAKTVVGSSLVKTAIFGADANWGRVIAAMGRAGATFNPEDVTISFGDIVVLQNSTPVDFSEEDAKAYLEQEEVVINAVLNEGEAKGTAWGCDLTYDYVKINGSYRS
ncbi:bifunctional glutamate N-acetyltransferase/amino-acid acetyltransferase ArgJ [Bacillus sp. JJ722]|uniref:bifunctional glutamate N-acetyltransferase/amino-acid acetyltransferase ArgJ n=1 Tax=Bacillus sp. JJ722 TaxID=3122973 RepID=UPI003000F7D9